MGTGSIGAAVLLGNGDGTFQAPTTAGPFSGAPQNFNLTSETLTISDFNNDGHMDIASIGIILFGNGNGAFQSPLTFFTWPGSAASIWSGDLDANGTADIVLTSGAELRVFLGNGNGTFHGPSQDPNYFAFSNSIKAVDVAGTGQLDLVIARSGAIDVFVGNGDGTFQPWVYFEIENCNRYSILAEDFDGDTRRDIVGGCFDSGRISLMSNGAPISLSQITLPSPAVISIQAGQTLALSVVLSGVTGPTFRWRRNGIPLTDGGSISGAATSDLSITPVLPQDSGIYDILLGADCRSATSRYVSSVTVNCACGQRPTFTQQPANRTVLGGGSATYSTMVNGTGPLAYQWRRSGVPLTNAGNVSGADTSTLTLSPVSIADGGFAFDCVVTDSCGSDRSDPAGLQVITTTQCHGDFNNDGSFNGNDIQFIVDALLSGQACP